MILGTYKYTYLKSLIHFCDTETEVIPVICMIDTCDIEQKKQTCINSLIQLCVMLISTALFLHNTIYSQKILMLPTDIFSGYFNTSPVQFGGMGTDSNFLF